MHERNPYGKGSGAPWSGCWPEKAILHPWPPGGDAKRPQMNTVVEGALCICMWSASSGNQWSAPKCPGGLLIDATFPANTFCLKCQLMRISLALPLSFLYQKIQTINFFNCHKKKSSQGSPFLSWTPSPGRGPLFFLEFSSPSLPCEAANVVLTENKATWMGSERRFQGNPEESSPESGWVWNFYLLNQSKNNLALLSKVLKFNIP